MLEHDDSAEMIFHKPRFFTNFIAETNILNSMSSSDQHVPSSVTRDPETGAITCIHGYDPRYHRHYDIEIMYYDDKDLLIINKPCDVRIDGSTESCPTIESYLQEHFPQFPKHYLIHQLDYVTSGIHCWALSKRMAGIGGKAFSNRRVKKTYTAIVKGHVEKDDFKINKPIAERLDNDKFMCIGDANNPGRESLTHVKVRKRGYFKEEKVTLLELSPHTGRRHQLRVHLASIGHPILRDVQYEDPVSWDAGRTMLHAWKLHLPLAHDEVHDLETENPFEQLVTDHPVLYGPAPAPFFSCTIL